MIRKYGIYFFLLVLTVHCLAIWMGQEPARTITKLLLVPVLMAYLYASLPASKHLVSPALPFAALFFSFMGDLFLTQTGESYFLLGMGAFIVTHITNSLYFMKLWGGRSWKSVPLFFIAGLLLGISVKLVYNVLRNDLGALQVPILLYMAIISLMGMCAVGVITHAVYGRIGLRWFVPGAALFIASDAMLALDKFHFHEPAVWAIPVMLTYGLAQCLLVTGVGKQQGISNSQ